MVPTTTLIRARLVVKVPSRLILLLVVGTEPPQLFLTVNDVVMRVKMPQPPTTMLVVSPPYQRLGIVFWRNNQSLPATPIDIISCDPTLLAFPSAPSSSSWVLSTLPIQPIGPLVALLPALSSLLSLVPSPTSPSFNRLFILRVLKL
jgi:hypothetical protein